MKLFFQYLYSKRRTFLACLLFSAVFGGVFALYRLPLAALLYPAGLCLLLGLVLLLADFSRVKRQHAQLSVLQARVETILGILPPPHSPLERDYQELVRVLCDQASRMQSEQSMLYQDMADYYTVWVHQIKTPISSMKLALQEEDTPLSRRMLSDLFRIEQYVEMVLTYLRLDGDSTDYVFRICDLDGLLRTSVRKFAPEFISRKLRLDFSPTDYRFITDEKWLAFVIEQLLSNALKYTRVGAIRIFMEPAGILYISDTGIGIAPEELPRVFEKGYTGFNGRTDSASSGIGLYLCRRICDNLGIGISASSEVGKGTVIRLDLTQHRLQAE